MDTKQWKNKSVHAERISVWSFRLRWSHVRTGRMCFVVHRGLIQFYMVFDCGCITFRTIWSSGLCQSSSVRSGVVTRLRAGRSVFRVMAGTRDFPWTLPDWLWGPASLLFNWHCSSFQGIKWPGFVKSSTNHHIAARLRMSGAVPLLPYIP